MHCWKIYDQILATNQVQLNTKPANTKVANISTRFFLPSFQTISSSTSSYHPKPGNTFSSLTNNERLKLMKKGRCFDCRQLGHTMANYRKSITKIISVAEIVGTAIDNSKISGKE